MIVSVDFDNTIALYDEAFRAAALERGLVSPDFTGGRAALRALLRQHQDGETAWMTVQGYVYGAGISRAVVADGFRAFAKQINENGHRLVVVSHKTQYGHFDPLRVDLRVAALDWMKSNGLVDQKDAIVSSDDVYFEPTRAAKVARIASLAPSVHVDDLIEVFTDTGYPRTVRGVLLADRPECELPAHVTTCRNWTDVRGEIADVATA